jgi:hypothetical protein
MAATTSPSTLTEAFDTRCTTTRIEADSASPIE